MKITTRTAAFSELEVVKNLAYSIWPVAYSGIISVDQINYMLEKMYSMESLQTQVNQQQCEFILGEVDGRPCGFASFAPVTNSPGQFKLHKLYVLPEVQGSGLGKKMLLEVMERSRRHGGTRLELQVNKSNSARQFYEHFGFREDRELTVDIGSGFVMDDYVMAIDL